MTTRIWLDPGHGGKDNGAHSTDGKLQEEDLVHAIATKMVALGADCCAVFPLEHNKSVWDLALKARDRGIPVFVALVG